MKFDRKATRKGPCAYSVCTNRGNNVYIHKKWRFLVCSQTCAEKAYKELLKIPPKERKKIWGNKAT